MMDHTQAVRKTVITGINAAHSEPGDAGHDLVAFEDPTKEIWLAFLRTRSGLLPEATTLYYFHSQEDLDNFVTQHPVGSEIDPVVKWVGLEHRRLNFIRGNIDRKSILGASNAGDEDSPLAFQVLAEAGLSSYRDGVSSMVLDAVGRQRIGVLKNQFGENWSVAAVFEYCWLNLPPSSPAYIAAAYQFQHYIAHDDFAAGYLWRDLEIIVHGVESAAIKSIEMRKRAGAAGSEKSAQAREFRRTALMDEIEGIALRNPDITKLGVESVARLAVEACSEKAPAAWRQGRGQVAEYLGEIRRGEAGAEMKCRFEKLFGIKPLRRS